MYLVDSEGEVVFHSLTIGDLDEPKEKVQKFRICYTKNYRMIIYSETNKKKTKKEKCTLI